MRHSEIKHKLARTVEAETNCTYSEISYSNLKCTCVGVDDHSYYSYQVVVKSIPETQTSHG